MGSVGCGCCRLDQGSVRVLPPLLRTSAGVPALSRVLGLFGSMPVDPERYGCLWLVRFEHESGSLRHCTDCPSEEESINLPSSITHHHPSVCCVRVCACCFIASSSPNNHRLVTVAV